MRSRRITHVVFRKFLFVCWCALPLLASGQRPAGQAAPTGKAGEPAAIEDVQEVTAVEPPARPAGIDLLGRMHPAVVHFPIAWVFLLLITELASLLTRREELAKACLPLLVLACLSFIPAAATGFLRASSMGSDPEFQNLVVPHRNMNLAAGVICLAALILRVRRRKDPGRTRWPHLLLAGVAAALVLAAGHLGGKMVFGPRYLPF